MDVAQCVCVCGVLWIPSCVWGELGYRYVKGRFLVRKFRVTLVPLETLENFFNNKGIMLVTVWFFRCKSEQYVIVMLFVLLCLLISIYNYSQR